MASFFLYCGRVSSAQLDRWQAPTQQPIIDQRPVEQTAYWTSFGVLHSSRFSSIIFQTDPLQRLMEEYSTFCGHPVTRLKFSFDGDVVKPSDTPEHLDFEEDVNAIDVHIFL